MVVVAVLAFPVAVAVAVVWWTGRSYRQEYPDDGWGL